MSKRADFSQNAAATSKPFDNKIGTAALRVLIIEDDEEMRSFLVHVLKEQGHTVLSALSGIEGFAFLSGCEFIDAHSHKSSEVNTIIADLKSLGEEGLKRLAAIKVSVAIFLLSSFGDADLEKAAKQIHAKRFFYKPFSLDDLMNALRQAWCRVK